MTRSGGPSSYARRAVLAGGASLLLAPSVRAAAPFADLEARAGGRLGVFAINTGTGAKLEHRAGERFAMCSTFKGLLAGAVLARVDRGLERLDRRIAYTRADLVAHAPVTEARLTEGALDVETLCRAIVTVSDNPAANLLLRTVGGPAGFTAWLRTLGDRVTRLDRYELELNTAIPGDPRDTTTPQAIVGSYRRLLLGDALKPGSRDRLASWMEQASTGLNRLRKDLPAGWRAGDKTGNGANGTSNDVAILHPPAGPPILVACLLTGASAPMATREAVMAEIGRLAAETLG